MTLELNLQKGLVGHWTMDDADTSAGTLYDRSSNDNHGTIVNGPIDINNSIIGDSYIFTGVSDKKYIDIPDSVQNNIDGGQEASLSVWMKLPYNSASDGDDTGPFSFQGSNTSNTHWVWTNSDGYFPTFRDSRIDNISTSTIELTEWHRLTITTEPGSNGWKLYINDNVHFSTSGQQTVSANDQALIGFNNASHYFNGEMSDFRLYNRALSEEEISALYNMRSQRSYNI